MPDGLTPRATGLLVALAFGLMVCIQALLGGDSSPGQPTEAKQNASAAVAADAPAAQPDVRLVAAGTVPALRQPRKVRERRVRKRKRVVRRVVRAAPTVKPVPAMPTATPEPVPTAAPRYIPPAPRQTPAPRPTAPKPTPAPPDSGDFELGEFDTTGER